MTAPQLTPAQKKKVRAYIKSRDTVSNVQIRADGSVHAYGQMPNTSLVSWYLAGYADDLLTQAEAADAILARTPA